MTALAITATVVLAAICLVLVVLITYSLVSTMIKTRQKRRLEQERQFITLVTELQLRDLSRSAMSAMMREASRNPWSQQ